MFLLLFSFFTAVTSLAVSVVMLLGGLLVYLWISLELSWLFRMCNYEHAWMAWIPLLRYYALAEVTGDQGGLTHIYLLGIDVPTSMFRFWPVLTLIVSCIGGNLGSVLEFVLEILCLGTSFTTLYSKFENRPVSDVKILGYLSGWLPVIAWIKLTIYRSKQLFY